MKIALTLLTIIVAIAGAIGLTSFFVPEFSRQFDPPSIIQVKAYLDNRCSIGDEAFVAFAPEQERTAKFYGKTAIMRLPENAKIQLSMSQAYPDFQYDDVPQDVAPEVFLVADCSAAPRLNSIFNSMNKQFKN